MLVKEAAEKVLMAMSGGVDSSVGALVLRDAGYDVTGVTMKLFGNDDIFVEGESSCCSLDDVEDARQVCLDLGLEHFVYNFTHSFAEHVVERFCRAYLAGETPNPCIDCNRYLKFEALQQRRRELSFDYVATGHYARRAFNAETGRYELKRGLDANKDQSYVLFHLTQDTLAHMLFPLGDLTKPQVRALAQEHGFSNARKTESQDICFVPDGDYAAFIRRHDGDSSAFHPGPIVDREGKLLGKHSGLIHYTIGQRKGIGVAAAEPLYVFSKDVERNELVVDTAERTRCDTVKVRDVNFISRAYLEQPEHFTVKTHYRQKPLGATVEQTDEYRVLIHFDEPQRACAAGQAAVLYDDDTVVCGGTIER
ncbi:MAG: tRNA 2-thiouridine(34) synthase MnmA [Eggerthellaceae bacterium]|nr:tRNA 2-thiouridine(34) synthase MnmA [Eggerthellaceae bacterium]